MLCEKGGPGNNSFNPGKPRFYVLNKIFLYLLKRCKPVILQEVEMALKDNNIYLDLLS
jgi:hypothetical protein